MAANLLQRRKNEPSPPCPPGLEATQSPGARPPVYVPTNYLDQPVYKDDDDGWIVVAYKKKPRSKNRRSKSKLAPLN
jgi:hypothetical protein